MSSRGYSIVAAPFFKRLSVTHWLPLHLFQKAPDHVFVRPLGQSAWLALCQRSSALTTSLCKESQVRQRHPLTLLCLLKADFSCSGPFVFLYNFVISQFLKHFCWIWGGIAASYLLKRLKYSLRLFYLVMQFPSWFRVGPDSHIWYHLLSGSRTSFKISYGVSQTPLDFVCFN